eukprot:82607_1
MESVTSLVEAHLALRKLEKEIDHIRCDLINRYMRQNDCESNDLDELKQSYYEMTEEVEKEKHQFEQLLNDFPVHEESESQSQYAQDTIDNMDYDESSTSSNALYASSVDATSTIHQETQVEMEKKEQSVEEPVQEQKEDDTASVASVQDSVSDQEEEGEEYPALSGSQTPHHTSRNQGAICKNHRRGQRIRTVENTRYRYTGKGFDVFTGKYNRCKP